MFVAPINCGYGGSGGAIGILHLEPKGLSLIAGVTGVDLSTVNCTCDCARGNVLHSGGHKLLFCATSCRCMRRLHPSCGAVLTQGLVPRPHVHIGPRPDWFCVGFMYGRGAVQCWLGERLWDLNSVVFCGVWAVVALGHRLQRCKSYPGEHLNKVLPLQEPLAK